jgi:hypothetical protein
MSRTPKLSYRLKGEEIGNFYDALDALGITQRGELMAEIYRAGFAPAVKKLREQKRQAAA